MAVHGSRPARRDLDETLGAQEARGVAGTHDDPIQAIEDLPGLSRPAFDSGQLVVWGSAPQDTQAFVDGVPVPQLFHGSSLRSTVNGDLVRSVTLSPGAYGADYGRSLGGIVRVETADLPSSGAHGAVRADTLDGAAIATAAPTDRVRLAVAGRYGWIAGLLEAVDAADVGDYFSIPQYRDYQAKAQWAMRSGESLDFVVLGSGDDLTRTLPDADPAHARSQATHTAFQRVYLHYRRTLDDGSSVEVVPWLGFDSNTLDDRFGDRPASLDQATWRWGVRASHRSRLAPGVRLALGLDVDASSASLHRNGSLGIPPREGDLVVFGQPPGADTNTDRWNASMVGVAPYASLDLDLGPLALTPGVRFDSYLLGASRQTPRAGQTPSIGLSHLDGVIEPNLAARLKVTSNWALIASAGLYSQPPAAADLSAVFGTPSLGPESAAEATLGETLRLTSRLTAEVLAFYKAMDSLAVRDPSPTPHLAQALLQDGVGRAYGIQWLVRQQPWHGFSGWIAYTIRAASGAMPPTPRGGSSTTTSRTCSRSSRARRSAHGRSVCACATREACRAIRWSARSTTRTTTRTSRSSARRTRFACPTSGSSICGSTRTSRSARARACVCTSRP